MKRYLLLLAALLCSTWAVQGQSPSASSTGATSPGPLPAGLRVTTDPLHPAAPAALPATAAPEPRHTESPPPRPEALVQFDYRRAELQWTNNRWQITAGDVVLKDFGPHATEARQALALLRELRLTQMGTVGTPRPIMEYWLAEGRAPSGFAFGIRPLPLDRQALHVEQVQGQWCLRDTSRILFNFGPHAEDAQQALAIVQHYGFSQVASLGRSSPLMLVFLGDGPETAAATQFPKHRILHTESHQASSVATSTEPGGRHAPVTSTTGQEPAPSANTSTVATPGHLPGSNELRQAILPAALSQTHQLSSSTQAGIDGSSTEQVPLEWRAVQVRHDRGEWKLVQGEYTLASFGNSENEARLAEAAVQNFRFTEQCRLGSPQPTFSYFLVNGQAPRGSMVGVENIPFRPESLTVQQHGSSWGIDDGVRTLFDFGEHADDARAALRALQRYHFDTLCRIGHPATGAFTFLVRTR